MQASTLANRILRGIGSSLSFDNCLSYINDAQNLILGIDNTLMRIKPDPYFATTAGTYSYLVNGSLYDASATTQGDLLTSDIRKVVRIYSPENCGFWPTNWPPGVGWPRDKIRFTLTESSAPLLSDCRVDFKKDYDPGDSTISYNAIAYRWPAQVPDGGNAPLEVPEDFCTSLLLVEVMKMLEREQYGSYEINESAYVKEQARFINKYGNPITQDSRDFLSPRW